MDIIIHNVNFRIQLQLKSKLQIKENKYNTYEYNKYSTNTYKN